MLSEALRLIRVFHDVKQNELAERLGISKSYLSEIEAGKKTPTFDLVGKYSSEFHIPASSILFFAENIQNPEISLSASKSARGIIASKVLNFLTFIEKKTAHVEEA